MKRWIGLAVFLAVGTGWAADKPSAGNLSGYTAMSVDAGYVSSSLSGRFEIMRDGVRITLLSDDPARKPVPISATEVRFVWPDKTASKQPSRILLQGRVVIEHPDATVRAEKAEWDFDQGLLTFTGSPTIDSPQMQGLRGDKIVLNFKEDRFEVFGGKMTHYPLSGMGGEEKQAAPPIQFRAEDVRDWPGLTTVLKENAKAEKPSPGKRIVELMDGKAQEMIASASATWSAEEKAAIISQLNRILANPKLYSEEAWAGVQLPRAAVEMLGKSSRPVSEQMMLNRLLIEAAFPAMISASKQP